MQYKKICSAVFAAAVALFITVGFLLNIPLMLGAFSSIGSGSSISGFISSVQNAYTENFHSKESYINLNGLFARLAGIRAHNNVARLENGMLTANDFIKRDMSPLADEIAELEAFAEELGIKFVYTQIPVKADLSGTLVSYGNENYANENANELLSLLESEGVYTFDLREQLTKTAADVEKYFYVTDHHWNSYGAFAAFQSVTGLLGGLYPDRDFSAEALNIENWKATVYEDWFLGSHGKRVGKHYAGVDDLTILTPKFDTDMSMWVEKHSALTEGSFEQTVIKTGYLDAPDLFNENPYCSYIGGDYPLVKHINNMASNDLHVLIIKDSFSLPLQAFLSTELSRLDVIDPRHYTDGSVADYIAAEKPDIVFMMINPSVFGDEGYYSLIG